MLACIRKIARISHILLQHTQNTYDSTKGLLVKFYPVLLVLQSTLLRSREQDQKKIVQRLIEENGRNERSLFFAKEFKFKLQKIKKFGIPMLCVLYVGTVPMLCIFNVGTVPTFYILNVGTVPMFSPSLKYIRI